RQLRPVLAFGIERLDGRAPQLVLHGWRGKAGNADVKLRRLLVRRLAIGLPRLEAAVRAPVFGNLLLHVPRAVLLVRLGQLLPGVERRAALLAALDGEVFYLQVLARLLQPRIVAVERRH